MTKVGDFVLYRGFDAKTNTTRAEKELVPALVFRTYEQWCGDVVGLYIFDGTPNSPQVRAQVLKGKDENQWRLMEGKTDAAARR